MVLLRAGTLQKDLKELTCDDGGFPMKLCIALTPGQLQDCLSQEEVDGGEETSEKEGDHPGSEDGGERLDGGV